MRALNNLQSLASVREKWEKDNVSPPSTSYSLNGKEKLLQTAKYLNICGIKVSEVQPHSHWSCTSVGLPPLYWG